MRVYDSQGRVTGKINGEVKREIPNSDFDEEYGGVLILFPEDSYIYEIFCITGGNYVFSESGIKEGNEASFTATNIPIVPGETHRYEFDWELLAQDKEGATLSIDKNSDGNPEQTLQFNDTLSCEEFLSFRD